MIQFGNWQIRQHDRNNLTLFHKHTAKTGKDKGVCKWMATGHYFQSVKAAITYALNAETMERAGDANLVLSLREAIQQEERIANEFREWLSKTSERPQSGD